MNTLRLPRTKPAEQQTYPTPMSSTIWSINWSQHFPLQLSVDGFDVTYASYDQAREFLEQHFSEIYQDMRNEQFYEKVDHVVKEKFLRHMCDFFLFRYQGEAIGCALGNVLDWSSYYFRNVSILEDFQGQRLYQQFFPYFACTLSQAGVVRLEGDVSPSNVPHVHALQKMGVQISGVCLSERWGAMLRFTTYLDEESLQRFKNQFIGTERIFKKSKSL